MHLSRRLATVLLLSSPLLLVACGDKDGHGKDDDSHKAGAADADHKAPHGGEVLELGEEEGHLEIMHDHEGGKMTVYVYGASFKDPVAVARPTVTIQQKDGTMAEVTLSAIEPKPDGTAQGWKGEHAGLISDPWNGRIRVKIGSKEFQSPLEGEGHGHK